MPEKPTLPKGISEKNTKPQLLDAYHTLLKQLEEKRASELHPQKKLETAYQKVQDIAEKAVESSSQGKSLLELQKFFAEQTRKTSAEKA